MTKKKYEKPAASKALLDEAIERFTHVEPDEVQEISSLSTAEKQIEALLEAFEGARHETENGAELWYGRDLQEIFDYGTWAKFRAVIQRAWNSCKESGVDPTGHFVRADGQAPWSPGEIFSQSGKVSRRGPAQEDVILSRRACYLIAENGDPSKVPIAVAQRYFAEQTRRQEIADQSIEALTEDQRRVLIRDEVADQQKGLASAAHASGVTAPKDFAIFQSEGYRGMYGGLNVDGIKKAKDISGKDQVLDRMGSTELAANLFRLTQAEERLRKGDIRTKAAANRTHHDIGKMVRKTMIEASGVPPEKLEAADHIKHARKRIASIGANESTEKIEKKNRFT
jgi:DNA-damage-inducible protein D